MMRRAVLLVVLTAAGWARAQTHAVKKPETVVRAVAVYEWTGDEAKPTASRLVPVSIFINSQMEDAGVYLARPVPFALDRGTIFEAQQAGEPKGTIELAYQRHVEGENGTSFDDGWLGYGLFKPEKTQPTPVLTARKNQPLPQVVTSGRPHFSSNTDSSGATTTTADDSSRPTMKRRTDSGGDTTASAGDAKTPSSSTSTAAATSAKDDDPDRPVLVRRDGSSDTTADATPAATPASGSGSSSTASTDDSNRPTMQRRTSDSSNSSTTSSTGSSDDDADRPTLKRRTPTQQAKNQKRPGDTASVQSASNLNDDPDRPTLHRGTAIGPEIPPLNGLPKDMKQMVAVSDAKDRPAHDFIRPWDSDEERAEVLARMREMARGKLASYDVPAPPAPAPAAAAPPAKKTTTTARTKKAAAPPPPPPPPVALDEESLRGYTLSYGGAATFVYSASSPGAGGATRYVSVVAQKEPLGDLKLALASVTDSNHLDRTPWMRLVDVVDAEASNRASLLFEMRAQNARQFALYRVIGARAEQVFTTGTTE
jgi:hypothetical protein